MHPIFGLSTSVDVDACCLPTWVAATVSLTLPNFQVSATSVVEREGVVC